MQERERETQRGVVNYIVDVSNKLFFFFFFFFFPLSFLSLLALFPFPVSREQRAAGKSRYTVPIKNYQDNIVRSLLYISLCLPNDLLERKEKLRGLSNADIGWTV